MKIEKEFSIIWVGLLPQIIDLKHKAPFKRGRFLLPFFRRRKKIEKEFSIIGVGLLPQVIDLKHKAPSQEGVFFISSGVFYNIKTKVSIYGERLLPRKSVFCRYPIVSTKLFAK